MSTMSNDLLIERLMYSEIRISVIFKLNCSELQVSPIKQSEIIIIICFIANNYLLKKIMEYESSELPGMFTSIW